MTAAEERELDGAPYEFSPAQNQVIGSLANAMKWVALPAYVAGTMALFYLIMTAVWAVKTGAYKDWQVIATGIFLLANVLLYLALARWTLTASVGFRAITETSGRDMGYLMLALNALRKTYTLLAAFVKVFVLLMVLSLILSVIGVFTHDKWPQFGQPTSPAPAPATTGK
jgi:hypothetical protein